MDVRGFYAGSPRAGRVSRCVWPEAAETVRRGRDRPPKDDRKVNQTLHLDADVLEAYRREGAGWQTRINQILREHMPERPK